MGKKNDSEQWEHVPAPIAALTLKKETKLLIYQLNYYCLKNLNVLNLPPSITRMK